MNSAAQKGIGWTQAGLLINAVLVLIKFIAGIVGNANALVADAVESSADIFSSLIAWMGLSIAARPADHDHPYGHGKAEPLAAAVVSLMLLGAAVGISIMAVREITTPHHLPSPFTLFVAAGVIAVKEILFRLVSRVGRQIGSAVIVADAWHHRSDATSSLAAFIGISTALWLRWPAADDYAALVAALIVAVNGIRTLRPAISGLMDEAPDPAIAEKVMSAARGVDGVRYVEHLNMRRSGLGFHIDLHVQSDPSISLEDAHEIAARVKYAIFGALPSAMSVLVHMEPFREKAKPAQDDLVTLPQT